MPRSTRTVSREEFGTEIQYQGGLPGRTGDEAKEVPGSTSLMRTYLRRTEDAWADQPGPVREAEEGLRKMAAIAVRGMVYTRVWPRGTQGPQAGGGARDMGEGAPVVPRREAAPEGRPL